MIVTSHKTNKVQPNDILSDILDVSLPPFPEKSIVVVTSKIVSLCEGAVQAQDGKTTKVDLARNYSDYYVETNTPPRYGVIITIKNDTLIANSGIDESNTNNHFAFWPTDPDASADYIWNYLREKRQIHELGIIISDSAHIPLRWGSRGIGIAWCGFEALQDYIGTPDLFGRTLQVTKASIVDGLAGAAVVVMGEGAEQTPLATVSDIPFVTFQNRPPTPEEREAIRIQRDDDLYAPLLTAVEWKRPA